MKFFTIILYTIICLTIKWDGAVPRDMHVLYSYHKKLIHKIMSFTIMYYVL